MMKIQEEARRCMLCLDAPCTKACSQGFNPAKMVLSVRFLNEKGAANNIDREVCARCEGSCEKACIHYDFPIRIRQLAAALSSRSEAKADLSIDFLGIKCENPFFLSSSVIASGYEMCDKALSEGWGGIVYKTIGFFMPEEASPRFDVTGIKGLPFEGFRNIEQISEHTPEYDFDVLKRLKKKHPTKVIVASIMGQNTEEWKKLAIMSEEAGCDIIECNFSCPHMTKHGMGADVGTNPELVAEYTKAVKEVVSIPVLAKMTPNITNMEVPAIAAVNAGADGLAAINTIKSLTGFNLEAMASEPQVGGRTAVSGYSGNAVKPIALRFIHDMAAREELKGVPISGMGGIETWKDALDFILLGCGNIQVTTAVMQYGYRIVSEMKEGLMAYMCDNGIASLSELVGKGLSSVTTTEELDRTTISYPKFDRDKCTGCGRCIISCFDAGHQALYKNDKGVTTMDASKCVGCHLCRHVCPAQAIGASDRIAKRK